MSTLNLFLKSEHPDILREFNLYIRRDRLPAINATVVSRVSGYGGSAGRRMKVIEYGYKGQSSSGDAVWGENYIVLLGGGGKYLCKMENWWKELDVLNEPTE